MFVFSDTRLTDHRAELPCCGKAESTVQYCHRCIQVIVEHGFEVSERAVSEWRSENRW